MIKIATVSRKKALSIAVTIITEHKNFINDILTAFSFRRQMILTSSKRV